MIGVTAVAAVALQLVNVSSHEVQADGHSIHADISGNGRLVVFDSLATNLSAAPLQRPDDQEVYLRDRRRGVTRLVSRSSRGRVSNGWSWQPSLSPNGRFVAFYTGAHLASADTDALSDVYLRDRRRGVTRVASPGAVGCYNPPVLALTPRAGYVVHWCDDGLRVLDRRSGRVRNASPTLDGRPPDRTISEAGVSADGRTVVFCSEAYNLSRSDGLGDDVYVWHRAAGIPTVVSNAGSCVWSADVSSDGRTAVFTADMPGLVAQDVRDVRQSDAFTAGPLR
jgi:hypothetical protein